MPLPSLNRLSLKSRIALSMAERVIFTDQGQIVAQNTPHELFTHRRSRDFLSKILGHSL
jgi:general L-amino acid transport system ATP-binding protein